MDIIKRGSVPLVVYEFTCGNCRSVLHANKDEVEVKNSCDPRDSYTTYSITCPVCHKIISVYKDPKKTIREEPKETDSWVYGPEHKMPGWGKRL